MILNPVIQGGGTLPEKVNIRYSSVVIYYMTESETGTFEIDNTTNAQSGTIEVFVGSPIFINGNLQRSSGIEKINGIRRSHRRLWWRRNGLREAWKEI